MGEVVEGIIKLNDKLNDKKPEAKSPTAPAPAENKTPANP